MQPITGRCVAVACATLIALAAGANASTPSTHRRAVASSASHALNLTFEGGPAGFEAALKRNLEIRARQFNVDPADYADEIAQIHQIVADCMTVTADDWRAADAAQRAARRGVERGRDRAAEQALVRPRGPPVQVGVREAVVLHVGDEVGLGEMVEVNGGEPRA